MIASIENRLHGAVEQVASVAALAMAMEQPATAQVTAYVVPLAEQPKQSRSLSRKAMQEVDLEFGVVLRIVVPQDADQAPNQQPLEHARDQVRERLFGWMPEGATAAFQLGSSDLIEIDNGELWWIDRYTCQCQRTVIQHHQ